MADKVHCAHILVKTETEAKNIKARLDKGEKFGALAKNVSTMPICEEWWRPWHFHKGQNGQGI